MPIASMPAALDNFDGPRRRALLGCLLATFATSPGQTFVVSAFHDPLREALGLSATALAAAYMAGTLLSALLLTHAGRAADRFGPRRVMAAAGIGLALAGLWMASVVGLVTLIVGFFLLRFTGQGVLGLAAGHALALRFERRLGAVEGLRAATISLAVALVPLAAVALVAGVGWRGAWVALGAGGALTALVSALALLDPDPAHGPASEGESRVLEGHTLAQALRTRAYWTVAAAIVASALLITAVHFHLQPLFARAGLDAAGTATTLVTYAMASLFATLVGGPLTDRLPARVILAIGAALLGAGCAWIAVADDLLACHLGMVTMGVAHACVMVAGSPTLARFFGRAHHGAIRGSVATAAVAGTAAGPLLLGWFAEHVGGYRAGLLVAAAACVPLAIAAATLRRPPVIPPDVIPPVVHRS